MPLWLVHKNAFHPFQDSQKQYLSTTQVELRFLLFKVKRELVGMLI